MTDDGTPVTPEKRRIQLPRLARRRAMAEPPELAPEHTMDPDLASGQAVEHAPVEQSVVDAALYQDGKRIEGPKTVGEAAERLRQLTAGAGQRPRRGHGLDRSVSA